MVAMGGLEPPTPALSAATAPTSAGRRRIYTGKNKPTQPFQATGLSD